MLFSWMWLQTELNEKKSCYQLIITISISEKSNTPTNTNTNTNTKPIVRLHCPITTVQNDSIRFRTIAIPAYSVYPSFHTISTLDTNSGGRESLLVRRKTLYFVYCNRIIPFSIVWQKHNPQFPNLLLRGANAQNINSCDLSLSATCNSRKLRCCFKCLLTQFKVSLKTNVITSLQSLRSIYLFSQVFWSLQWRIIQMNVEKIQELASCFIPSPFIKQSPH